MVLFGVQKMVKEWKDDASSLWPALVSVNRVVKNLDPLVFYSLWVGAFFQGITSLGLFGIYGLTLSSIIAGYTKDGKFPPWIFVAGLIGGGLYYVFVLAKQAFMSQRSATMEIKFNRYLSDLFVEKVDSLDLGRLIDPGFLRLKDMAMGLGKNSISNLPRLQFNLVGEIVGIVASVGVMGILDPLMMVLAFLPVIPQTFEVSILARKEREMRENNHLTERISRVYEWCLTGDYDLIQNRLFGFGPYFRSRYRFFLDALERDKIQLSAVSIKWQTLNSAISLAASGGVIIYLGHSLIVGSMGLDKVVFFVGSVRVLNQSLSGISRTLFRMIESRRDYRYLEDFLATKPMFDEVGAVDCQFVASPRISFDQVVFGYPNSDRLALNQCSFTIEPGERVAMVGRNGSGKTTAARLLAKIYPSAHGRVCLNNNLSLASITQRSWNGHVLYSSQDGRLQDLPVAEALAGQEGETVPIDRLWKALELSGAKELVENFPEKQMTRIGERWLGGVGLSSGQHQRLKQARAFYRLLDPEVYLAIFDEPMSNCDMETRESFYSSLKKVGNKTIIVIAHDPLYLHHFERVLVMEKGQVIKDLRGQEEIQAYKNQIAVSLSQDL